MNNVWATHTLDLLRTADLCSWGKMTNLRISSQIQKVTGWKNNIVLRADTHFWTGSFSGFSPETGLAQRRQNDRITGYLCAQSLQKCIRCSVSAGTLCVSGAAVCGNKHISLAARRHINPLNRQRRNTGTLPCFCYSPALTGQSRPCSDGSFTQDWSTWLF